MGSTEGKRRKRKISPEFASRLAELPSGAQVRVVVLLKTTRSGEAGRDSDREAAVERVRASAASGLAEIDAILDRFGGRRLRDNPDALGSLPVESTADGLAALARSESVRAILEDQPGRLIQ